jgi:murein DD-endopeptidase MepM/ murein hydrolase activator NlpD
MRRALLLTLIMVPSLALASPSQSELVLRDLVHRFAMVTPPDLSVLTTEPVERSESSGYGWREDPVNKRPKFHHGTDYRGKPGTPVLAAGNGVVVFARRNGSYGNVIFVDHGGGIITRYAHLSRIEVREGALVSAGDRIGRVGSTGRTTGPHLHFEVRLDGRDVDPNTAMLVAGLMRESPSAGQLAAFALAPELQAKSRDREDPKNRLRAARPDRKGAPKREAALW